jgi:predicted dehydrogenase
MAAIHRDRVRVAMIGAGGMANKAHYPALASLKEVQIEAICDLDTARLNATADKYAVEKRFTDYRKMIEEIAPDAVYAIGQPQFMYDIWIWCLQHKLTCTSKSRWGSPSTKRASWRTWRRRTAASLR